MNIRTVLSEALSAAAFMAAMCGLLVILSTVDIQAPLEHPQAENSTQWDQQLVSSVTD